MSDKEKSNPSIVDVAEAAGVSAGTVSRVINANPKISAATVRRVITAMDEVGYEPPHPTRRRGKSSRAQQGIHNNQIAVVQLETGEMSGFSSVLTKTWAGIRRSLAREDLAMVMTSLEDLSRPPAILDPKQIDGVILQGYSENESLQRVFGQIPAVYVYSSMDDGETWYDQVHPDDDAIGNMAAEYLLSRDRTALAYLNPVSIHGPLLRRGQAFANAAKAGGATIEMFSLEIPDVSAAEENMETIRGRVRRLMQQLLSAKPLPDGLFLPGDLYTALVQVELIKAGVVPGKDITLISCNNEERVLAGLLPRPASIDVRPELVGDRAVDQLMWRMANRHKPPGARISVPPLLIDGDL